jgi:hypothetical protein
MNINGTIIHIIPLVSQLPEQRVGYLMLRLKYVMVLVVHVKWEHCSKIKIHQEQLKGGIMIFFL